VPEPQVTEKLGTMDRKDRLEHLKLDNDAFANKKIDPIPVIDSQIFVTEWDRDLPLHRQTSLLQFIHQAGFVRAFEQSWPYRGVHLHR
jgi:hypothetical protein